MKFQAIYRASFYLMLTFATLVLSIDATDDNPFSMLYPVVVAFACFLAFVTVDRNPKLSISREAASWLAIGTMIPSIMEWYHDENLLLLSAAHWLVYLQLVKLFLPKTVEDDWFLFLLGLVQVLVGGVMSQSDKVGIALFTWALLALWVLTLFALHREAIRMRAAPAGASRPGPSDRSEPYQGLLDLPFAFDREGRRDHPGPGRLDLPGDAPTLLDGLLAEQRRRRGSTSPASTTRSSWASWARSSRMTAR